MEPGHIIIIDEYCSSPLIKQIAERLLEARYQVIVIGPGSPLPRDPFGLDEYVGLKDLLRVRGSTYPDHGHYRVDFRTGKPLRY